jgi:hypothetical protein
MTARENTRVANRRRFNRATFYRPGNSDHGLTAVLP